jgi:hypothetical protein
MSSSGGGSSIVRHLKILHNLLRDLSLAVAAKRDKSILDLQRVGTCVDECVLVRVVMSVSWYVY